jgi:hypothetical protein
MMLRILPILVALAALPAHAEEHQWINPSPNPRVTYALVRNGYKYREARWQAGAWVESEGR